MGLHHSPQIVTDGLVLCLDAQNTKSYPGSGTTWIDLSGTGNNGTLQASPTFVATNPFRFNFAAANSQFVSTTTQFTNPQTFSIGAIFKTTTTAAKKLIGFENTQTNTSASSWDRHLYVHTDGYLRFGVFRSTGYIANTSYSVADGAWRYAVGTFSGGIAKLYVNGQYVSEVNAGGSIESSTGWWRIGAYKLGGVWGGTDGYYDGDISFVHVYTRALTENEITQNFNAIRGRFNI